MRPQIHGKSGLGRSVGFEATEEVMPGTALRAPRASAHADSYSDQNRPLARGSEALPSGE